MLSYFLALYTILLAPAPAGSERKEIHHEHANGVRPAAVRILSMYFGLQPGVLSEGPKKTEDTVYLRA